VVLRFGCWESQLGSLSCCTFSALSSSCLRRARLSWYAGQLQAAESSSEESTYVVAKA